MCDRGEMPYVLGKAKIQEDAIYTNSYVVDNAASLTCISAAISLLLPQIHI